MRKLCIAAMLILLGSPVYGAGIDDSIGNIIDLLEDGATTEVLVGGGGAGNTPVWGTDIPTTVTIGGGYVYRAGGTMVAVADGGTNRDSWSLYAIPYSNGLTTFGQRTIGSAGQYLRVNAEETGYEWGSPEGAGNVLGPTSNTDGYIPLWNGTDSKTLKNGIANDSTNWSAAYAHKTTEDAINGLVFCNGAGGYSAKAIGTDVQAYSAYLADIAGITATRGDIIFFNGTDWVDLAPGTSGHYLKTQGGGADPVWSTLVYDTNLAALNALSTADGNIIVGNGSTWVAESGATARTSLGLGNVDNTSDANKPVSTAQQTALNLKANLASPTFTGTVTMPGTGVWNSSGNVGIGTVSPASLLSLYEDANSTILSVVNGTGLGTGTWMADFFGGYINGLRVRSGNIFTSDVVFYAGDKDGLGVGLSVKSTNLIGIGTTSPTQKLHVVGNIYVSGGVTSAGTYADYVFEDDYALPKLDELNEFVSENKHLPGMTVNKGGTISHNQAIHELLVKVEEQSRYILELHDRLKTLEGKL